MQVDVFFAGFAAFLQHLSIMEKCKDEFRNIFIYDQSGSMSAASQSISF